MQNMPSNQGSQNNQAQSGAENIPDSTRPSFVVKRSVVTDIVAAVICVIAAAMVWFFAA